VISGYFRGVPLCPLYGFGGIILLNSFALLSAQPGWIVVLASTIMIIVLEYIGGRIAEHVLEERLWDYSKERFNLHGYISAKHSILWLIVVTILYVLIGKSAGTYITWLGTHIPIESHLDVLVVFIAAGLSFLVTIKNKKLRLSRLAEKQLEDIQSIEEMFDFRKLEALRKKKNHEIFSRKNIDTFLKKVEEWNT
jgi:uncharacterized membrane protein